MGKAIKKIARSARDSVLDSPFKLIVEVDMEQVIGNLGKAIEELITGKRKRKSGKPGKAIVGPTNAGRKKLKASATEEGE